MYKFSEDGFSKKFIFFELSMYGIDPSEASKL